MSNLSQAKKILEFLVSHPNQKFSAREIAISITEKYVEDYIDKRKNPRFKNDSDFISQIVAEIGSQKESFTKKNPNIFWQDKPRPRIFWFDPNQTRDEAENVIDDEEDNLNSTKTESSELSEHDLYPLLIDFLKSELNLYCLRIDEKTSKNSGGSGKNHWLHPDVVAMQPLDKEWDSLVRESVKLSGGQSVRLWSFEVKKVLNTSNARKSYFQAVSNSSWANEGYLVARSISNIKVEQELRMLSALHGIGVILLNVENPIESDILLPATSKNDIDWLSVNRIVEENKDFRNYIDLVTTYYQTGRIRERDWNK